MPDDRKPRAGTVPGRDILRHKTPPKGSPAAAALEHVWTNPFADEPVTGQYEGPELDEKRAQRPTEVRIARLEKKQDDDRAALAALSVNVARIDGKLEVLPELVSLIKGKTAAEHETKRLGMTTHAKVVIAIVGALGAIIGALAGRL